MDVTDGGLYAAIMQQYGTEEEASAFVLMSIESGPLVSMHPRLSRLYLRNGPSQRVPR
jgi:hypothetical protein